MSETGPEPRQPSPPPPGRTDQEWRQEFPFQWNEDDAVTRRDLLRFLVACSGGLALATWALAVRGLFPAAPRAERLRVAGLDELQPNSARLFHYPEGGEPAILIRLPDGALVAYSDVCTHLSCAVRYLGDGQRLHCPCHDGVFDARTGQVLAGPPARPLPRIELSVEQGAVWATREVLQ